MNEFCCVCLSKGRKLDRLSDDHWNILLDNVVNKTIKSFQINFSRLRQILYACSECKLRMDGIVEFKGTALTGLDYVSQCYSKNPTTSCSILQTNMESFTDQCKKYSGSSTFKAIIHGQNINEEPEIAIPNLQMKIEIDSLCEVSPSPVMADPLNDRSIKIEIEETTIDTDIESMLFPSLIIKENAASDEDVMDDKKDKDIISALQTSASETVTIERPSVSQMVVTVKSEFSDESTDSAEELLEHFKIPKAPGVQYGATPPDSAHEITNNPKLLQNIKSRNLHKNTKRVVIKNARKSNTAPNTVRMAPKSNLVRIAPNSNIFQISPKTASVNKLEALPSEQKSSMLKFILENVKTVPTLQVVNKSSVTSKTPKKTVFFPNSLKTLSTIMNDVDTAHNSEQNQRKGMWYRRIFSKKEAIEQLEQRRKEPEFINSKFKCDLCVEVFKCEPDLDEHFLEMHNEKDCKFVCPICKQRFKAIEYLRKIHIKQHCDKYICALCNLEAPSSGVLTHHKCGALNTGSNITLRAMGRPKYKEHKCDHCGEIFQDGKARYRHVISKHKKLPPAQCNTCNRSFKDKFKVLMHIRRKHQNNDTLDNMAFFCKPCGLRFNTSSSYKAHMRGSLKHLSQDDLKNVCDFCGRRFLTEKDVRRHIDLIHLKKQGPHKCAQCPKAFYAARRLKEHVQIVHEKVPRPRKYMCDMCAKAFTCSASLKDHMNHHTGARPYKCSQCPSAFGFKAALYTHIKLVHEKVKRVWKKKKTGKRKTKSQKDGKEKNKMMDEDKLKTLNDHELKPPNEDEVLSLNEDEIISLNEHEP